MLGAALISQDALEAVAGIITPADFYQPAHAHIWAALQALHDRGEPTDPVTIAEHLRGQGLLDIVGGHPFLVDLQTKTPSTTSAPRYAQIVRHKAQLRRVIHSAQETVTAAYADDLASVRRAADATLDTLETAEVGDTGPRELGDVLLNEWFPALEERAAGTANIPTGFHDLDKVLGGGWRDGHLNIVGGRASMGKSAVAVAFAAAAARAGHPVLIGSVEMAALELADRWVSSTSRISAETIRRGVIPPKDLGRLNDTVLELGQWPVYVDDRQDLTVAHLAADAKAMPVRPRLIIVDYLQILTAAAGNKTDRREEEVARISADLKRLARRLACPVIALAQLNRTPESRSDKRPLLTDLRESGSLEMNADVVLGLYREKYYKPDTTDGDIIEISVLKQRAGPLATIRLAWIGEVNAVESLTMEPGP